MFKKILRILIKIPATPFVTVFLLFALLSVYAAIFLEWLYDADDCDKRITLSMKQDVLKHLKKWFTTV
jgi:hypothetical protein